MFHVKRRASQTKPKRTRPKNRMTTPMNLYWLPSAIVVSAPRRAGRALSACRVALLFGSLACIVPGVVHAAIYKCTGSDSKVVISDQPCANDQRGGALNVNPASGAGTSSPTAAPKASPSTPALGSVESVANQRKALLAVLSPECQNLSRRFWDLADRVGRATQSAPVSNPADDALAAEFASKYQVPTQAFLEKRNAEQSAAANKRAECATKKSVIDDKKPRSASLTSPDKTALAAVERDYALNCS